MIQHFSNCCGVECGPQTICPHCMERCEFESWLHGHQLPLRAVELDRNQAWDCQDASASTGGAPVRNEDDIAVWGAVIIDATGDSVALVSNIETAEALINALLKETT